MTRLGVVALVLAVAVPAPAQSPPSAPPGTEVIAEVRVHGNYATSDADVLSLAGITIGQPIGAGGIEAIRARLVVSRRFADVEVRKRYRSLTAGGDVVLVILVREYPTADTGPVIPGVRPPRLVTGSLMALPVLDYVDGYGFTYGARVSFVDVLGRQGRVSTPLTWGGMKRAAIEADKELGGRPIHRLYGGASISRRENPFYEQDEGRRDAWIGASRIIGPAVRLGGRVGYADVSFGGQDDAYWAYGVDVTLDTRLDTAFPRNAVLAAASWEGLDFGAGPTTHRYRLDGRGYLGLPRASVLAVRTIYESADRRLPPYLRPLLGGRETLRGFRAGAFADTNLCAASVELRVPFTSPLGVARTGFTMFTDVGTAYPRGVALSDSPFHTGVGGGLFVIAPVVRLGLDVARGFGSGTRAHFSLDIRF